MRKKLFVNKKFSWGGVYNCKSVSVKVNEKVKDEKDMFFMEEHEIENS